MCTMDGIDCARFGWVLCHCTGSSSCRVKGSRKMACLFMTHKITIEHNENWYHIMWSPSHQLLYSLPILPHSIPINNQYAQHEYLFEYIDG